MAITIADVFAVVGAGLKTAKTKQSQHATLVLQLQDYVDSFTMESIDQRRAIETASLMVQQSEGESLTFISIVMDSVREFLTQTIQAEYPDTDSDLFSVASKWIDEFESQTESFDSSAIGSSITYGSGNVGTGKMLVSTLLDDGKVAEFCFPETITLKATTAFGNAVEFTGNGELSLNSPADPNYPGGSGARISITSGYAADTSTIVTNGTFTDTDDDYSVHRPTGWDIVTATLGTTLKITSVEVQTVIISGTPTSGYYLLQFTNSDGKVIYTSELPYNATQSQVQAALNAIPSLENVTVETTGTTPNLTHTITFYDVPNPTQLASESFLNTGSIAHATSTAGSSRVVGSDRALEFDSNGSQLTAIQQRVTVDTKTTYAVSLLAIADSVPAAGVITVDLVDGIGGSVIADDEGTNNTFTITCSSLSNSAHQIHGAMFRTPTNLPGLVFLRIRITTAISNTSSVFINQVQMFEAQQLYVGGPFVAIIPNSVNWKINDTIELDITNDRAGEVHEWMNRIFRLRDSQIVFPIDSPGTVADTILA